MLEVVGNTVVGLGDRHIDDRYVGQHKNYLENCIWGLDKTLEICKTEKPDFYFETGDFVGVNNNQATLGNYALYRLCEFLSDIKCPKVVNLGNHDLFEFESLNTYTLLSMLGYYRTPDMIKGDDGSSVVHLVSPDIMDENGKPLEAYIHFVSYGKEGMDIHPVEGALNVAVTHNDFKLGSTVFTRNPDAIDLTRATNFKGIDLVVNGHIHTPSDLSSFNRVDNEEGLFINLGCMARPKRSEDYLYVNYIKFGFIRKADGVGGFYVDVKRVDLPSIEDTFVDRKGVSDVVTDSLKLDDETQAKLGKLYDSVSVVAWNNVSLADRLEVLDAPADVKECIGRYLGK